MNREWREDSPHSPGPLQYGSCKPFSLRTAGSRLFHFNYGSCSCCWWVHTPIFRLKRKQHTHTYTHIHTLTRSLSYIHRSVSPSQSPTMRRRCQNAWLKTEPGGNSCPHLAASPPSSPPLCPEWARAARESLSALEGWAVNSCTFLRHTGGKKGSRRFYALFQGILNDESMQGLLSQVFSGWGQPPVDVSQGTCTLSAGQGSLARAPCPPSGGSVS